MLQGGRAGRASKRRGVAPGCLCTLRPCDGVRPLTRALCAVKHFCGRRRNCVPPTSFTSRGVIGVILLYDANFRATLHESSHLVPPAAPEEPLLLMRVPHLWPIAMHLAGDIRLGPHMPSTGEPPTAERDPQLHRVDYAGNGGAYLTVVVLLLLPP